MTRVEQYQSRIATAKSRATTADRIAATVLEYDSLHELSNVLGIPLHREYRFIRNGATASVYELETMLTPAQYAFVLDWTRRLIERAIDDGWGNGLVMSAAR